MGSSSGGNKYIARQGSQYSAPAGEETKQFEPIDDEKMGKKLIASFAQFANPEQEPEEPEPTEEGEKSVEPKKEEKNKFEFFEVFRRMSKQHGRSSEEIFEQFLVKIWDQPVELL